MVARIVDPHHVIVWTVSDAQHAHLIAQFRATHLDLRIGRRGQQVIGIEGVVELGWRTEIHLKALYYIQTLRRGGLVDHLRGFSYWNRDHGCWSCIPGAPAD